MSQVLAPKLTHYILSHLHKCSAVNLQQLASQLHTTNPLDAKKKAVIFDMGGVILPSPFAAGNSKMMKVLSNTIQRLNQ